MTPADMSPGDVRTFKRGGKSLVLAVGVWAAKPRSTIHIHVTGGKKFHITVTDKKNSERYHRVLFRNLRRLLVSEGRWPFGEEGEGTEQR